MLDRILNFQKHYPPRTWRCATYHIHEDAVPVWKRSAMSENLHLLNTFMNWAISLTPAIRREVPLLVNAKKLLEDNKYSQSQERLKLWKQSAELIYQTFQFKPAFP